MVIGMCHVNWKAILTCSIGILITGYFVFLTKISDRSTGKIYSSWVRSSTSATFISRNMWLSKSLVCIPTEDMLKFQLFPVNQINGTER
jgi:hypothetical protein